LNKYDHIIWDWNGTIIDDADLCVDIVNELLSKNGLDLVRKSFYQENFVFPVCEYYSKIGLASAGVGFDKVSKYFITEYRQRYHNCSLHDNITALLETFKNRGINHSVLSAGCQNDIDNFIKSQKLDPIFDFSTGVRNTDASGKIEIADIHRLKIFYPNNKILLIGDTVHDYEVASHLGIDVVLFSGGHNSRDRLLNCNTIVIDNFEELNWVLD
jgi:phosphoglycolate phosphatase